MKPAARFASAMRSMTDEQCREVAASLAEVAGILVPVGKSGKTMLRIVARDVRLAVRDYHAHKDALLDQLALLGA